MIYKKIKMPKNDLPIDKDERNGKNDQYDIRRKTNETNALAKTIAVGSSYGRIGRITVASLRLTGKITKQKVEYCRRFRLTECMYIRSKLNEKLLRLDD